MSARGAEGQSGEGGEDDEVHFRGRGWKRLLGVRMSECNVLSDGDLGYSVGREINRHGAFHSGIVEWDACGKQPNLALHISWNLPRATSECFEERTRLM